MVGSTVSTTKGVAVGFWITTVGNGEAVSVGEASRVGVAVAVPMAATGPARAAEACSLRATTMLAMPSR